MIQIPDNIDSKYRFVILSALRARQIQGGSMPMIKEPSHKATQLAQQGAACRGSSNSAFRRSLKRRTATSRDSRKSSLACTMKIALGVSGGIACYKAAEILRRLQDRGFDVVVVMTRGATQFVTPLTFRALSGNKVYMDIFEGAASGSDPRSAFDHIFLAQSIDLFLVAPATADCIAKLAAGIADDFLTTFHLAVQSPDRCRARDEHADVGAPFRSGQSSDSGSRGVHVIQPETGRMACRHLRAGRLAPVEEIVEYVSHAARAITRLEGKTAACHGRADG